MGDCNHEFRTMTQIRFACLNCGVDDSELEHEKLIAKKDAEIARLREALIHIRNDDDTKREPYYFWSLADKPYRRTAMIEYDRGHARGYAEALEDTRRPMPTLRDFFAMSALSGMLAANTQLTDEMLAEHSYMAADAMLKARENSDERT